MSLYIWGDLYFQYIGNLQVHVPWTMLSNKLHPHDEILQADINNIFYVFFMIGF
jgi:hypothetical protein